MQFMHLIISNTNASMQSTHRHFIKLVENEEEDNNDDMTQDEEVDSQEEANTTLETFSDDSDEDNLSQELRNKLKYFRVAFIQEMDEVTRPDKVVLRGEQSRLYVENGYMNSFATRGRFGFNKNESKAAIFQNPGEPTPKKLKIDPSSSTLLPYNRVRVPGKRTVSEFLLVALAIRHYTTTRENPHRTTQQATSREIHKFIDNYFKRDGHQTRIATDFVRQNVDTNSSKGGRYPKTNWFIGIKHEEEKQNKWVFGMNTQPLDDGEETIEQAIQFGRDAS